MKHEFAFDVNLRGAIRVRAESLEEAQRILAEKLDCANTNFGAFDNGDPILGEVSLDGRGHVYQIDGKEPETPDPLPDYRQIADKLYTMLSENQVAWDGEEDSVKEEHEELIDENEKVLDEFAPLFVEARA